MGNKIYYAILTCLIAYILAAFVMFIFAISQTGWSRIDGDTPRFMVDMLTLGLSQYEGWGNFWYFAVIVPFIGSSLVLALLLQQFAWTAGRRYFWGGFSVAIYYVVVLVAFAIGKLITFWGDIEISFGDLAYVLLLIFPLCGFIVGYIAAMITEKIIRLPAAE